MLLHECLECQKNKPKRKDLNEAPLQQWGQLETIPMKTIHIDHKSPLRPSSHGKNFCLGVIDAFSRYLQVYPCTHADTKETIKLLGKYITTFGIPQQIIHNNGSAFMSNGKVEVQSKRLTQYFRHFLSTSGSNWSELTNKFAFAQTANNSSTGYTPYEIVFGIKPQVPLSLKLGLYRDQNKRCTSEFCAGLENYAHTEHKSNNETIDRCLKNQISAEVLKRENDFKLIYSNTYTHCHRITNKAHMFRNQVKLGRPIKEGTKVLLENRSKPLLKSQKLLNLRSGPYIVIEKITEVTYGIQ